MESIKLANLALRFLLELCALAALGYAGFQLASGLLIKIALAIGAPLLAVMIWGTFIAPKATIPVPLIAWLALQAIIFGLAIAGLAATGHTTLAIVFVLALAVNATLLYIWRR